MEALATESPPTAEQFLATPASEEQAEDTPHPKSSPLLKGKILYCFAGPSRRCDVAFFVNQLSVHHDVKIEVVEYDLLRGGLDHDLANDEIVDSIIHKIHNKEFSAILLTPPCNTFSRATYSNKPGPPPLRSKEHPHGLPGLTDQQLRKVRIADKLITNTIRLAKSSSASGLPYIIEHPEDLGATPKGTPASIWSLPEIVQLATDTAAHTAAIYQCQDPTPGSNLPVATSPKPTRLLGTAPMIKELRFQGWPQVHDDGSYQGPLPSYCGHNHKDKLIGFKPNEQKFKTQEAAAYPAALCNWLARALMQTAITKAMSPKEGETATPPGRGKKMRKFLPLDQWETSDEDELGEPKWKLGTGYLQMDA